MKISKIRLSIWVLVLGVVIMSIKFVAWWWTNSNAILTDALESIINVAAGSLGLYSLLLAAKPKDTNHPYGHGKIEFISAGVEGSLIVLAGLGVIGKAIYNLYVPQAVVAIDLGIYLTILTGLLNFLLGSLMQRVGRQQHSITLQAGGKHLKMDALSSAGLVIGLFVLWMTELNWVDHAAAILFGIYILYSGYQLIRESLAGIMDEANYALVEKVVQVLEEGRRENWIDVHNLRIITYGADLHIDCHLTIPWYFDARTAHAEVKDLEELLAQAHPTDVEVFVHLDPCRPPTSCSLCAKRNCRERLADQEAHLEWTSELLMRDQPHARLGDQP